MRDPLHIAPEVPTLALTIQHLAEDLPRRREVPSRQVLVEHPLVGAQVHVALGAIIEHEHLAVPERVERPGVDVEVPFHLDRRDDEALVLEHLRDARSKDALSQTGHDRSEHNDVAVESLAVPLGNRAVELGVGRGLSGCREHVGPAGRTRVVVSLRARGGLA